jgi:polar amino acid transport system permease protein
VSLVEAAGAPAAEPRDSARRADRLIAVGFVLAIMSLVTLSLLPAIVALVVFRRAKHHLIDADEAPAHLNLLRPGEILAKIGLFLGVIALIVLLGYLNRDGLQDVRETFFNWDDLKASWPAVRKGFWLNIQIFVVAEAIVLVWAMVVAVVRQLPGPAAAPLRWLAIAYIDVFRGLPAIVTIYLIGFGLPLTGLPWAQDITLFQLGVLALTLVYGAYVAEVYRAGMESVHWSQAAAARSLGFSHAQTLRFVIVPQAVRRVVPPLLNDFIGLQKDTALIGTIGLLDGFNRARIYAGNNFNLSSMVGLGICFVVITIPMTRFVDWLVKRDQRRLQAVA